MEAREATATGESCMRVDAIAKVTGRARYTDDGDAANLLI